MKQNITIVVAIIALLLSTFTIFAISNPTKATQILSAAGGMLAENYIPYVMYNDGYKSEKNIELSGANGDLTVGDDLTVTDDVAITGDLVSIISSATTTVLTKSTSATKGFCQEFNATSTNTTLNLTYYASSTAISDVGIAPRVRFGVCS